MRLALRLLIVGLATTGWGCIGGVNGNTAPDAGGGGPGGPPVTGAVYFDPDIQASMDIIGCDTAGCHGGTAPMHVVPPAAGGIIDVNYKEVMTRAAGGAQSLLLTKPVMGAAAAHDGGKLFTLNDNTYKTWLAWITAGAPLRANNVNAPPPDMATPPPPPTNDGGLMGDFGPPLTGCVPLQQTTTTSHNKGTDCLSCHSTVVQNPAYRWTIAGTLFQDKFGVSTKGGAAVTVVDAKGTVFRMITDVEGNFYSNQPVTFPISTTASGCPNVAAMVGKVMTAGCNATNCHDANRPMYLP